MAGYGRNYYGDNRGNRGGYDRGYQERRPQRDEQRTYINQGSLFIRDKRSPKAPDVGGDITIGGDVLTYILDLMNKGEQTIKLEIAGWKRRSRNGDDFTSLAVNIPYSERDNYQQDRPDERRMMRGGYAQQSGRRDDRQDNRQDNRSRRQDSMSDDEFARGDSLPDFMRDDGEPPF